MKKKPSKGVNQRFECKWFKGENGVKTTVDQRSLQLDKASHPSCRPALLQAVAVNGPLCLCSIVVLSMPTKLTRTQPPVQLGHYGWSQQRIESKMGPEIHRINIFWGLN